MVKSHNAGVVVSRETDTPGKSIVVKCEVNVLPEVG